MKQLSADPDAEPGAESSGAKSRISEEFCSALWNRYKFAPNRPEGLSQLENVSDT